MLCLCKSCWHNQRPAAFHSDTLRTGAHDLPKRTEYEMQPNAPDQLKVISQPQGTALKDLDGFSYSVTAGQDVRVYIIDSGVDTANTASISR